jgi:hypothetical protein
LLRRAGFALTVILTLPVGIGANVAAFSVVHAVLIRPFAYPAHEPDRVLRMAERSPQGQEFSVSYVTFHDRYGHIGNNAQRAALDALVTAPPSRPSASGADARHNSRSDS